MNREEKGLLSRKIWEDRSESQRCKIQRQNIMKACLWVIKYGNEEQEENFHFNVNRLLKIGMRAHSGVVIISYCVKYNCKSYWI